MKEDPARGTGLPAAQRRPRQDIGWREDVGLPDLGISRLKAKVDTGARTSALHAENVELDERDGKLWVSFTVPHAGAAGRVSAPVLDERDIRNTSGRPERRYVIRTALILGRRRWKIDVSLADRTEMAFDLILGRTAIRGRRISVNPGRSFLAGPPAGSKPGHMTFKTSGKTSGKTSEK
ncbi:ATP-dependent zinc protease [Maritimibacter sp. 55A14]|uniref:ATP-dependent zinc protease family protein n=1 Tax=Maritimibacter sp. 55A14 TaxID=2174844 RepID=UPI000D616D39|nr:RimK/LysX family protein [Maritimibacter sp. 55A14]PWE33392.1 ATP-dependent zinc protease [Maritimibacter sp. 55A14]